jgi:dipeptidyl aminopeptidase/acylaminoacyl peptidase
MTPTLPWLWLVLAGGAAALLGARHALHRGLAPQASTDGTQPADLGLDAQGVRIPTRGGLRLFAWYLPPPASALQPAPAAVLLHGWGGNASTLLPAAQALNRAGFGVLLPESRNHGRSDRGGHSSLPVFADDLDAALDWLGQQPGVDAERLATIGHSVGAAAVLLVASRRSGLAAAVSVAAFAHPEQVMRRWLAAVHVPYWPLGWGINRYVEVVIGTRFDRIAPLTTLPQARCPVLLLHGVQDSTVPVADAHTLMQHQGPATVTLLELAGTHEGFADPAQAEEAVLDFLRRATCSEALAA